jgi:hypothetical protein
MKFQYMIVWSISSNYKLINGNIINTYYNFLMEAFTFFINYNINIKLLIYFLSIVQLFSEYFINE